MKLGILQCGHIPDGLQNKFGNFPDMFSDMLAGNGFDFETYAVVDGQFPANVNICEGWLVTGSKHGAYEDHGWIAPLEDFIRQSYAKNVPITGICFGHQIMAQALGGKVVKFPGGWGVGRTNFNMVGGQLELLALHQDQVVELPDEARVIASSDFCANAGLAYKGSALSFQPHPEFSPQFMCELVEYKISEGFSKKAGDAAIAKMGDENDSAKIAALLTEFYLNAGKTRELNEAAE